MNKKKINDLNLGLSNEIRKKSKLEKKFGGLTKTTYKYDNFDYFNDKFYIELKTRRIYHNQYESLYFDMCKYNKGLEYLNQGYRVIFIWDCKDKMVCWELKSDEKVSYCKLGGRTDRGKNEISNLCNIATKYLIDFDSFVI